MSARQVIRQQLTCDGCGVVYPHLDSPVAKTRAHAAENGWKHRAIQYSKSNWMRQVDVCPACVNDDARVIAAVSGAMRTLEGQRGS